MIGAILSPVRCEGCDCLNETVEVDPDLPAQYEPGTDRSGKDWPCCNEEAAPCSYVVIAECDHPHPAYEDVGYGYGLGTKATGFPTGTEPQMMYPVFELKKECITGCRYSWNFNLVTDPRVYPIDTYGVVLQEGFPTYRLLEGGGVQHVKPRWMTQSDIGCLVGEAPEYRLWQLVDISVSTVQLTWDFHGLPGQNDPLLQLEKSAPVYESVSGWIRWGRNRMRLTEASQREWPSLRPEVCVVAVDYPYLPNSCETLLDRCNCMDPGTAQTSFDVTIAGCSNFSGTYTVLFSRYRQDLGDTLPCGVSYPASAPCGVFWSDNPIGTGEEICVNEGVNWTGSALGFLNWCDGTDYHVELFCYNRDTSCWVSQGEATVTLQEPRCRVMYLEFTLPPLDCCCEAPPISTDCCPDDPTPPVLTFAIESTCPQINGITASLAYDGTGWVGTFSTSCVGALSNGIRLYCRTDLGSPEWWVEFTGDVTYNAAASLISCFPLEVELVDDAPFAPAICGCAATYRFME